MSPREALGGPGHQQGAGGAGPGADPDDAGGDGSANEVYYSSSNIIYFRSTPHLHQLKG